MATSIKSHIPNQNESQRQLQTSKTTAWSDEQWDKLETYLIEFGQLQTQNEYLYNLQLEFLGDYIGSDIGTIKGNLEELVRNKSMYSKDDFHWESNKTKLMNEVDNIILSFDLQPYADLTKPAKEQETKTPSPDHTQVQTQPQSIQKDSGVRKNEIDTIVAAKKDRPIDTHMKPKPERIVSDNLIRKDLPRLSKTERRMSLDLMHSRPVLPQHLNHKRTSSLSKPALATTSNVNVLTKPELSGTKPVPDEKKPQRFHLNSIIPKRKVGNGLKKEIHEPQSPPELSQQQASDTDNNKDKRSRRVSLVGENLPNYIRDQLHLAGDGKKLSKKQSRLHNLLANSESLYAHSKDTTSSRSEVTGTSDYNSHDESSDDKEYISPNSLTKYYELEDQAAVDDMEDIDFVNVNERGSFDQEEQEEEEEENDNDDDYLFRI